MKSQKLVPLLAVPISLAMAGCALVASGVSAKPEKPVGKDRLVTVHGTIAIDSNAELADNVYWYIAPLGQLYYCGYVFSTGISSYSFDVPPGTYNVWVIDWWNNAYLGTMVVKEGGAQTYDIVMMQGVNVRGQMTLNGASATGNIGITNANGASVIIPTNVDGYYSIWVPLGRSYTVTGTAVIDGQTHSNSITLDLIRTSSYCNIELV